jgi:GST-like protein
MSGRHLTLYGCKGCGSAAVEVMLRKAGLAYQFVDAIQWTPFRHHDDLARLNPLKQVPTLVLGDGTVMTESGAMMLWLGEKVAGLVPRDPSAYAQYLRWMVFVPGSMYSVYAFRDFPEKWADGDAAQIAFRERTNQRLRECWSVLESQLDPAPYLLGPAMTTLDIYLAMLSHWGPGSTWIAEACPKLAAAIALTERDPVVSAVWEKNFGN